MRGKEKREEKGSQAWRCKSLGFRGPLARMCFVHGRMTLAIGVSDENRRSMSLTVMRALNGLTLECIIPTPAVQARHWLSERAG
jgi:hypothetical protein